MSRIIIFVGYFKLQKYVIASFLLAHCFLSHFISIPKNLSVQYFTKLIPRYYTVVHN